MSSHAHLLPISVADYLAGEQVAQVRHEYVGGRVFAMTGGSQNHNLIAVNLVTALRTHLKGRPCKAFLADMKVWVKAANAYYYPDLVVTCDPADTEPFFLTRPSLIVEVLSPSTESIDRREKWVHYQRLETLREYVLVSQEARKVEVFRRAGDGREGEGWEVDGYEAGEAVELKSVGLKIEMDVIYSDIII